MATLSMTVASDGANRQAVTASVERIRGEEEDGLTGDMIKFDTAGIEGTSNMADHVKIADRKKRLAVMMSEMMNEFTGNKVEMVIKDNELMKADPGADGEKLQFGPNLCGEAWIRLTAEFMHSGFPSDPVMQGARWSREVIYRDLIPERAWTDLNGRKLTAALVSLDSGVGKFRRNSGEVFDYPVKKLSDADRKLIEEADSEP